jgi:purine-binding chemotaxis protein CheW
MEKQYCSFYLDGQYFGIDVLWVQEVLRYQDMTRVPMAPAHISGLINLRGQIITAIDLRPSFGMPPRARGVLPVNVIIATSDGPVSLLVDAIGDVLQVAEATVEAPPDNLKGTASRLAKGVCKLKGQLMLILDVEKTLEEAAGLLANDVK